MRDNPEGRGARRRAGWRALAAAAAAIALAASGTTYALARGPGSGDDQRDQSQAQAQSVTGNTGALCRVGYDTQTAGLTPPDDSTLDNVPASSFSVKKACAGLAIGRFTAEVDTPGSSNFIHLEMRATCTAKSGMTNPCTPGEVVMASPGHTFLQTGPASYHVAAVDMVWVGLKAGVWKFEVLPGGDGASVLRYRTFTVEMFQPVG